MNIVYYLDDFPKLSESFILNEIYELDQRGHNLAVCASNEPNRQIEHEEFNELDIPVKYTNKVSYKDFTELLSPTVFHQHIFKNISYDAPLKRRIANQIRAKDCIHFVNSLNWEPDYFHSHFATIGKFSAQSCADYYDVPFSITTHAYDLYKNQPREYTETLLHRADRIVTISEYNKMYISDQFTLDTPIDVVRAGIRPEKFQPTGSPKPNRVLTISRFVEKKGLQYALEAVSIAAEEIPDIEYHIIGSGELKSDLINKIRKLRINDNVELLSNVTDERLVTELNEARSFLLPCIIAESGDRDGIPVVLMEAMAMKTPPVSTTVSGIPELIDHEQNGLLTEPRNPEATADALIRLHQNHLEWRRYANAAREKIHTQFNIKSEVNKLETVFENARSE